MVGCMFQEHMKNNRTVDLKVSIHSFIDLFIKQILTVYLTDDRLGIRYTKMSSRVLEFYEGLE